MSLFLQTLVLRRILFSDQEQPGGAENGAPDAGCALPFESKGIPAAIDAAITGLADKDRSCMKVLFIPEARMMFVQIGADETSSYTHPDLGRLDCRR